MRTRVFRNAVPTGRLMSTIEHRLLFIGGQKVASDRQDDHGRLAWTEQPVGCARGEPRGCRPRRRGRVAAQNSESWAAPIDVAAALGRSPTCTRPASRRSRMQ